MKLPEEEADSELRKRLQAKFERFDAPVKEQVREDVFAALPKSSEGYYKTARIGITLIVMLFILGGILYSRRQNNLLPVSGTRAIGKATQNRPSPAARSGNRSVNGPEQKHPDAKQNLQNTSEPRLINGEVRVPKQHSVRRNVKRGGAWMSPANTNVVSTEREGGNNSDDFVGSGISAPLADHRAHAGADSIDDPVIPTLLTPIDSVIMGISFKTIPLPTAPESSAQETAKEAKATYGITSVFSASVLQTFQIVNLSQAANDRVQNFEFAPLLSSKSLSYKFTAGLERRHTQLFASYTYFRNWNAYEIGTNQVRATRIGEQQYVLSRLGEKHVEDDRSHLVGIGLRQSMPVPPNILKNYTIHAGVEYTRLIPKAQDLVWGSLGFSKQVYHSGGLRLDVGPYLQYSFIERKVDGQKWKSRPYQVGISLHVKMQ